MKMADIEEEVREAHLKQRFNRADLFLAAIGAEIASLFIIALALAILCAPWAFGFGVSWAVMEWSYSLSHRALPGWILGVTVFAFFCRYVWGSRLQRASRRAAEALIAGK